MQHPEFPEMKAEVVVVALLIFQCVCVCVFVCVHVYERVSVLLLFNYLW